MKSVPHVEFSKKLTPKIFDIFRKSKMAVLARGGGRGMMVMTI